MYTGKTRKELWLERTYEGIADKLTVYMICYLFLKPQYIICKNTDIKAWGWYNNFDIQ